MKKVVIGDSDQLLTPAEVAAALRINAKTVTRWADDGKISSIRTPGNHRRFRKPEVEQLLNGALSAGDPYQELVAAYPQWEISAGSPPGMWSAWRISADGRHRRIIIAPTLGQLAERLDAITAGDPGCA